VRSRFDAPRVRRDHFIGDLLRRHEKRRDHPDHDPIRAGDQNSTKRDAKPGPKHETERGDHENQRNCSDTGQVDGTAGKDAEVACWQAIDPYTNKPETMTFNYCCFAIAPTTASWWRIQGGL